MSATPAIVGWRHGNPLEHLLEREWLVTNGLGGYASGSLSGGCTRRYHGALIAALPAPHGRTVFVPFIDERLLLRRGSVRLSAIETTTETCPARQRVDFGNRARMRPAGLALPPWPDRDRENHRDAAPAQCDLHTVSADHAGPSVD
jgi:hypothetical protein